MLPQFKGATTIYDYVVKPLFAKLKGNHYNKFYTIIMIINIIILIIAGEADIDAVLNNVKSDKIYDNTKKKE